MQINDAGLNLIKQFEGLRLKAYDDGVGVWTIGYGHTLGVKKGDTITEAEATELLKLDVHNSEYAVSKYCRVPLTENEFSALVSFVFNVGATAFKNSTMLRLINQGNKTKAAKQFVRWVYAKGKYLEGLKRRREAERALFLKG